MSNQLFISVQQQNFDHSAEYQALLADNKADGALVCFTGLVRDFNQGEQILGLTLEHYPGMTEAALTQIAAEAISRWSLGRVRIIHRFGALDLAEQMCLSGSLALTEKRHFPPASLLWISSKPARLFGKKSALKQGSVGCMRKQKTSKLALVGHDFALS